MTGYKMIFKFSQMNWSNNIFALVILVITGCTSSTSNHLISDYPDDISRFASVSISAPGLELLATDSFSFHPNLLSSSLNQDESSADARQLIQDSIEKSFRDKGLNFSPYVRAKSDFWVVYVIALEDTLGDNEVLQKYGMMPGFVSDRSSQYTKGSLIMDIVDASSQRSVWRSSVQGLVAPDLPPEVRRQRLQSAIDQMLNSLPITQK